MRNNSTVMNLTIITSSSSVRRHIDNAFEGLTYRQCDSVDNYLNSIASQDDIILIHLASLNEDAHHALNRLRNHDSNLRIGIASDHPKFDELLELAGHSISAYFHSYMAAVHYRQMLSMLESGHSWFAPQLLSQMIELARQGSAVTRTTDNNILKQLTAREEQIAHAIAEGLSNKVIAARYNITERTVKAHLTNIYEKLGITDRLELARYILVN
jgi:DNA-binding NarL/FixJ family response regulator